MRTDDIVRQRFAKVFRGYDVQEVDLFLDDVIREMDRLENERNALLVRLEALLQELDRCDKLLHAYRQKEKCELLEPAQAARDEGASQSDNEHGPASEAIAPTEAPLLVETLTEPDTKDKPPEAAADAESMEKLTIAALEPVKLDKLPEASGETGICEADAALSGGSDNVGEKGETDEP